MILFFSGTGNSKYVAHYLADKLDDRVTDLGKVIKAGENGDFESEKPWVFVFPTYAWGAPHFLLEYLSGCGFEGAKKAYFVLTCGENIGDAGSGLKKFANAKDLSYMGTSPLVMPDNYVIMYEPSSMDESVDIRRKARPVMDGIAKKVSAGEAFDVKAARIVGKIYTSVMNPFFYKCYVKTKPFWVNDKCIGCGKCSVLCALNNIEMISGRPVWGNNCTHCTACINNCPTKAIQYGKKTSERGRYHSVEYGAEEDKNER